MTPIKYSTLLGLSALPFNDDAGITKSNLRALAEQALQNLADQTTDVQLNAYARIRVIEEFCEELKSLIEPSIVAHVKEFKHPTIKIATSTRKTYDYSGDSFYEMLMRQKATIKEQIDEVEEKIKARQKFLESLDEPIQEGELIQPARLVSMKTSIRTTISNG